MSISLRIEMIIIAVIFVISIFGAVNKKKMRLQYSLVWILISMGIVIIAFFPDIIIKLSMIMKIETPTNLLYLLAILGLLIICFYLTVIVSQQSDKIQRFIQMSSIEKYLDEREKEYYDEQQKHSKKNDELHDEG